MFKFLKDKIKEAVSKISKKVEEVPQVEEQSLKVKEEFKKPLKFKEKKATSKIKIKEIVKEEQKESKELQQEKIKTIEEPQEKEVAQEEKKGFFSKLKSKFTPKEEPPKNESLQEEKKGFFSNIKERITTTKISEEQFEELFTDLEIGMLENNVAFEVVDKIKSDLKLNLKETLIKRGEVEKKIKESLKESIKDVLNVEALDLLKKIKTKEEKPFVISIIGQNGSGKTTTLAKLGYLLKKQNLSVVFAAGDTFRKAAIEQIKEWGTKLNIKVIAQEYGSDSAAVAFDAISYAKAHKIDIVLIDTAGRQHSNADLMREMQKIIRVAKPDLKIFVGESITGSDAVAQADDFNKAVGIDGIILSKADVDEKGGAMISVAYITKKPIIYLGTGQNKEDLKEFKKEEIIKSLELE